MKTKSTKRALIASFLALCMCFTMLIGTTFAWFTDSVTSGSNVIQSGKLDVDLVDEAGNSMAGEIIEFVAKDGRAQNEILWEPGCTYETEPVYVVNNGNLALKYQIVINGINGNAKLLEAIEWTVTVNGTATALADLNGSLKAGEKSAAIVLSGHMKGTAGNEYQGLAAEGISISVLATQYTSESDSFDDQYDADAEYAAQTMLKNVAAVAAGESATVKLESDGYVVLNNESPIGAKVAGDVTVDLNGKTLFVKAEDGSAHMSLFHITKTGKLTVTGNGTVKMLCGANQLVTAIFNNDGGTLVIKNGTYKMDYPNESSISLIPTIVDTNSNVGAATTIIDGGEFYHTRNMFRNFAQPYNVASLIINGGTFNGAEDDWAAIWNQKTSANSPEGHGLVTINGGEFNYVGINNGFETGVTIADGVVVPDLVSSANGLVKAIKNGGKVVFDADITVDKWIMFSETKTIGNGNIITVEMNGLTIDGNGHTLTVNSIESAGNGNLLFDDASNLNISNLTIKKNCGGGAIGLKSGVISNVNFVGGGYGIHPGAGEITVENCTFATADGDAIYFEQERDNLTVTGCTFNQLDGENVILLRGDVKFTNNTINSGRTVNIVSGSPVVTGNNFNDVRLKVYAAATATVSGNTINNLVFEDNSYASTFTANILSEEASAALNAITTEVSTVEQLSAALATGNNIVLTGELAITAENKLGNSYAFLTYGNIDGNDKTITDTSAAKYGAFYAGNIYFVKNLILKTNSGYGVFATAADSEMIFSNVTIEKSSKGSVIYTEKMQSLILDNVVATGTGTADGGFAHAVVFATGPNGSSNITINSGTYTATDANGYAVASFYGSVVTINGGTFTGNLTTDGTGKIVVKGGTFNVDPSAYLADGYAATASNGVWTVTAK